MADYDFSFFDLVEVSDDVVIVTRADLIDEPGPVIVYVNKAFSELTSYSYDEVVGKSPRILQCPDTDPASLKKMRQALIDKKAVNVTVKNCDKFGHSYWLDVHIQPLRNKAGEVTHFVAIQRNVTQQKIYETELKRLAKTDPLTGLLNRRGLDEHLLQEQSRYFRSLQSFSVLMVDVDRFKRINDQLGHQVGDKILVNLAAVFHKVCRSHDVIARMGGEEFCILLPQTIEDEAMCFAERLRQIVAANVIKVGAKRISVSISIGVAEVRMEDTLIESVVNRADSCLYQAKESGRNRVCAAAV